ncbi:RagB/SusD family nutrient uptake outer membrane protein [Pedobacter flavus]|uniref:RagB/SusD family nutrient uptake outer membrane protein n=1 Tax=Pedobacter flavus TaxID=3113906 RepID=A0ABU7H3Z0_9SPHI|nr:RagB/SusD family nutrient uptake outer membrane protein [Pedobacter sp. VNH31]MEE1885698.1 RagB/SusD family nutrient uptake outer membrane protein [Pedobacter sp. VNH31]
MKNNIKLILIGCLLILLSSCEKFLDEKPNKNLAIPSKLIDFQALLDNSTFLNTVDGASSEISAGDFYLSNADYLGLNNFYRNLYTWQRKEVFPDELNEWFLNYRIVYRANTVINALEKPQNFDDPAVAKNIIGQAYFYRAKAFLQTLYVWSNAYDKELSKSELGIPLRLNTDFNEPSKRETVELGYQQVINDLLKSIDNLPINNTHVMRPSKVAAYGLLARTYLSMRDYSNAKKYADSSLSLKSTLLDFNILNATANFPVPQFNPEVLHSTVIPSYPIINNSRAKIDPIIMNMFEANDLRKSVLFKINSDGSYGFKGSYDGSASLFSGVAVNEVLLIRAECLAREGKLSDALIDLNKLGVKRFKAGLYKNKESLNQEQVITWVLNERRKELIFRGLRWMDIKRLNKEGAGISLSRTVDNKDYKLNANSSGFALPLPDNLLILTSMEQNP